MAPMQLLFGIWGCLVLAFVWLAWSTADLERQAFTLIRQRHTDAARSVLLSPEYEKQRQLVVQGIQAFLDDLRAQFNTMHRTQHTKLIWSFIATTAALAAWLGIWHALACRRHHRRLLSSMQRSEHEDTERALPEKEAHYWELFENASDFIYLSTCTGILPPSIRQANGFRLCT